MSPQFPQGFPALTGAPALSQLQTHSSPSEACPGSRCGLSWPSKAELLIPPETQPGWDSAAVPGAWTPPEAIPKGQFQVPLLVSRWSRSVRGTCHPQRTFPACPAAPGALWDLLELRIHSLSISVHCGERFQAGHLDIPGASCSCGRCPVAEVEGDELGSCSPEHSMIPWFLEQALAVGVSAQGGPRLGEKLHNLQKVEQFLY